MNLIQRALEDMSQTIKLLLLDINFLKQKLADLKVRVETLENVV